MKTLASPPPLRAPDCGTEAHIHHDHHFGQGGRRRAEVRTLVVALVTVAAMLLEIVAGVLSGSMALLADGIHMGGHALALGLAAGAYWLTRRYARDRRLSLGSGKINDLAAYTSALLLGASTLWLVVESVARLLAPHPLHPKEALVVAVLGLVVNLLSAWLLAGAGDGHAHAHPHPPAAAPAHADHHHEHGHENENEHEHENEHGHGHGHGHGPAAGEDHNLRAALVHVLADALTSVAAIVGLAAAWLWGWQWLDPLIALVAAAVVLRWAAGLLRHSGATLLDVEAPAALREAARSRLESVAASRVTDLHLWSVGQGAWTLMASVVSHGSAGPQAYKASLADLPAIHHPMVEIHPCALCRAGCGDEACRPPCPRR